ncbi:unnamed protein product [Rhizoctonia solani]|uniref:GH16 domain-containing protein n=1 Tax=Rhizoctonia solani TaxID=456999 RepID=A0A8H3HE49_9AGAM|nr:unnamed protein product [Rhizoctonia solani]
MATNLSINPPNWAHFPAREPIEPLITRPPPTELSRSKAPPGSGGTLSGSQVEVSQPHFSTAYGLGPDPARWGIKRAINNEPESDDCLHNPDPVRDRKRDRHVSPSMRGLLNVGCLVILLVGIILLFAGYPIIAYLTNAPMSTLGGCVVFSYNLYQHAYRFARPNVGLIDRDTPKSAYTRTSHVDGTTYDLIFSDEFNVEGRSFYPGDDPYWEAVDEHYWVTNNIEWYDPGQVKTLNGSLHIELVKKNYHDMNFTGGMLSTWNKFCFTEGYVEASISLPGTSNIYGLWPAFWIMGNLGRAGYVAPALNLFSIASSTCDVGTLANQTDPVTNLPIAARTSGPSYTNGELSYLGGQRLSACTCTSESDGTDGRQMTHPGPKKPDGSYVGRGAPEIDIIEAMVDATTLIGHVSQSGQWAPFNAGYQWDNETNLIIYDREKAIFNTFIGNERQQTTSALATTNQQCYTGGGGCFQIYGAEYKTGEDGYIQWVTDDAPVFLVKAAGLGPDPLTQIGPRPIPVEPMYVILNLGMSYNFGPIDLEHLVFPAYMLVDYVRVYQPSGKQSIGCNPKDYPTSDYINTYIEAYTNPNLTTWVDDYKQTIPKNRLVDQC